MTGESTFRGVIGDYDTSTPTRSATQAPRTISTSQFYSHRSNANFKESDDMRQPRTTPFYNTPGPSGSSFVIAPLAINDMFAEMQTLVSGKMEELRSQQDAVIKASL